MRIYQRDSERIQVVLKEWKKGKVKKSKSFSVYDTTLEELRKLILEAIDNQKKGE